MTPGRFERYVVLGDSTAEGLDDPDGRGGYRGWADRVAEHLAHHQGGILYANLAVRGRRAAEVRGEQLEPALALRPDLAIVVAGTNDLLRPRFDPAQVATELEAMQAALIHAGAIVATFTLPDLGPVMPLARPLRRRVHALAQAVKEASARTGARLVDFTAHPGASDPRLWSLDRLHANSAGHAKIAEALSHILDLPGATSEWQALPPPTPRSTPVQSFRAELHWTSRFLLPWLWRHARGKSSGDGRSCKRPTLKPFEESRRESGTRPGASRVK